jgi:hypothetical protein
VARRSSLWRALFSTLLLILFCVAAPLALLAGWARQATGDPAAYGIAASQAAGDPRVRASLANAVTTRAERVLAGENPTATEAVQVRAVAEQLGAAASRLAEKETFRDAWATANRNAYQSLFSGAAAGTDAPVVLDLSPLAAPLEEEVERSDLDLPAGFAIDPADLRLELLDGASAEQIRRAVARLDLASWLALAVAGVALLLSIVVATDRLAAIARAGFGLTIGMAVLIALMLAGQQWSVGGSDAGRAALGAILDAISQPLRLGAVVLALVGLLVAALFAGLGALRGSASRRSIAG